MLDGLIKKLFGKYLDKLLSKLGFRYGPSFVPWKGYSKYAVFYEDFTISGKYQSGEQFTGDNVT